MSFLSKWFTNEDTTPSYEDGFGDGQVSGYDLGKKGSHRIEHQAYQAGFNDGLEWEDQEDAKEMEQEDLLAQIEEITDWVEDIPEGFSVVSTSFFTTK